VLHLKRALLAALDAYNQQTWGHRVDALQQQSQQNESSSSQLAFLKRIMWKQEEHERRKKLRLPLCSSTQLDAMYNAHQQESEAKRKAADAEAAKVLAAAAEKRREAALLRRVPALPRCAELVVADCFAHRVLRMHNNDAALLTSIVAADTTVLQGVHVSATGASASVGVMPDAPVVVEEEDEKTAAAAAAVSRVTFLMRHDGDGKENKHELFSQPFVIQFASVGTTGAALYKAAVSRVSEFCKLGTEQLPFALRFCTKSGQNLKQKATESKQTTRAAIPNSAEHTVSFSESGSVVVCLDWTRDAMLRSYSRVREAKHRQQQTYVPSFQFRREQRRRERINLARCLEQFTRPEVLRGDEAWYCRKCKTHVEATKTMQLWRLPKILIIVLKRFEHSGGQFADSSPTTTSRQAMMQRLLGGGGGGSKISTVVEYPLAGLDLTDYVPAATAAAEDEKQQTKTQLPKYNLFGVVSHFGSINMGHYTATSRNTHGKSSASGSMPSWFVFDDQRVTPASRDDVLSDDAYALFYARE
jgi:hypothetical protein